MSTITEPKKTKKHYSGKEKMSILRKHLIEKVSVSEICDKYEIAPSVLVQMEMEVEEKV